MTTLARLLAASLALVLAACSGGTEPGDPNLAVRAIPGTVTGGGEEIDLKVTASTASGGPGSGTVTLTATHGAFPATDGGYFLLDGGLFPITTVRLDSAGNGWTTYACDVLKDDACHDGLTVKVTGTWNGVDAGARFTTITVTGCGIADAGHPPIAAHVCAPSTGNECEGPTDAFLTGLGVPPGRLNGTGGNGFDDDCDGLVDEGCECSGSGFSKDCWLVPATQVEPDSGVPVGWCNPNARGAMSCQFVNGTGSWAEDQGQPNCRGAQAPPENDSCGDGDYNCDGLAGNNPVQGCWCESGVKCPSEALTLAPYPNKAALPLLSGLSWLTTPGARARATNWTWTVLGGDCDNVLPHPTFALYAVPSTVGALPIGARQTVTYSTAVLPQRYQVDPLSPLVAVVATRAAAGLYPAFALSGDYLVQGEFDLNGKHFVCTQKVQVRAPGLRAELCWDTVGTVDVDLHLARLQLEDGGVLQPADGGPPACNGGWFAVGADLLTGCTAEDCFYGTGFRNPDWGYASSDKALPDGGKDHSACAGWGSQPSGDCTNPRLDRDNKGCTSTVADPTAGDFCAPENINLDNPRDGDRFAVGAHYYGGSGHWPDGGVRITHPHVNVYCNGERVLSSGYNPLSGQLDFPALLTQTSDFWTVATVTTVVDGGALAACNVELVPSRHGDPFRDGVSNLVDAGTDFCVDSANNQTPPPNTFSATNFYFVENGTSQGLPAGYVPFSPLQWCKH